MPKSHKKHIKKSTVRKRYKKQYLMDNSEDFSTRDSTLSPDIINRLRHIANRSRERLRQRNAPTFVPRNQTLSQHASAFVPRQHILPSISPSTRSANVFFPGLTSEQRTIIDNALNPLDSDTNTRMTTLLHNFLNNNTNLALPLFITSNIDNLIAVMTGNNSRINIREAIRSLLSHNLLMVILEYNGIIHIEEKH